jgi:AcrR family transcriptional regulator
MFARQAPGVVSTRMLAQASRCSHGMITVHFGSKSGLEHVVAQRLADALERAVTDSFATCDQWPFRSLLQLRRAHPRVSTLLVRAGLGDLDIEPTLATSTLGQRLVEAIEAHRGGSPARPALRSRLAAYGVVCAMLGLYTFEDFICQGTGSHRWSPEVRDAAMAEALTHLAELAADPAVALRLPRSGAADATPSDLPPSRAHGRTEVREALLNSAVTLFATRGPAALSIRDIARHAGVNPALIYRHFGSKQALVAAAIERSQHALYTESVSPSGVDVPMVVRFQRLARSSWIIARLLADGWDIRSVRTQFPVLEAVLALYPDRAERVGDLTDPALALHAGVALIAGAAVWDRPVRRLVGLDTGDDVDIDAPLSVMVLRLLRLPVESSQA